MEHLSVNKKISCFFLLVYFFLAFSVYPGVVPQRGFLMTALIIISLVLLNPGSVLRKRKNSIIRYLIFILVLDAISNFAAGSSPLNHFLYMVQYICLVSCIWVFCQDKTNFILLIKMIFWPAFIGGPLIGIYQLVTGSYMFGSSDNLDVFFSAIISNVGHSNSNYTAVSMLFCIALSGVLVFSTKKVVYSIALVISCVCIILTYSRTAIVSTAICIVLFFVCRMIYSNQKSSFTARKLIIIAIIFVVFLLAYSQMFNIVEKYLSGANLSKLMEIKQSSTADLRTDQWKAAIEVIFSKTPIEFFVGFGDNAAAAMGNITGRSMTAHNYIFGRLSENGIFGFIAAIIVYINTLIGISKIRRTQDNSLLWLGCITLAILLSYLMISITTWELICILALFDVATKLEMKYKVAGQ